MNQLLYIANMGDNTVSVIDTALKRQIDTIYIESCRSGIKKIACMNNMLYCTGIYDSSIIALDIVSKKSSVFHVCSYPADICLCPSCIYSACADSNAVVMLSYEGEVYASLSCGISPVSLCLNEQLLFCAHEASRDVGVISASDLYPLDKIVLPNTPSCVLSFDDTLLVACIDCEDSPRGCLYIYDLHLRPIGRMTLGGVPNSMAYAGDHKVLIVNAASSTLSVCDIRTGSSELIKTGALPDSVCCNDSCIFVTSILDNSVLILDRLTYRVVGTINVGNEPCGMCLIG